MMWALVLAVLAAIVGWIYAVVGWRRSVKLEFEREALLARLRDTEELEERSKDAFEALAGKALRDSSEQLLTLAKERFATQEGKGVRELERRKESMERMIEPIGKALQKTHAELERLGRENAGLRSQVEGMSKASHALSRETGRLSQALRRPNVRGRYGEIQLERVVELAGMRPYCDFGTQVVSKNDAGAVMRPDLVVNLPNDRTIVVDAKTSLDAYLDAVESDSPNKAKEHRERFASAIVEQLDRLSRKEYWAQFAGSPDFVVMFIPGDQFIDMALQERPELIENAAQKNVILASPSTLIGLLRAVHSGWREKRLGDSARELFQLGRELHERAANVLIHADSLGNSLKGSVDSYNSFVGSMEERLLPTLRKFEERGASSAKELALPRSIHEPVRKGKRLKKKKRKKPRALPEISDLPPE